MGYIVEIDTSVNAIKRKRMDKGWSISDLASRSGLTFTQVFLAEQDQAKDRVIKKIWAALNKQYNLGVFNFRLRKDWKKYVLSYKR
jgi:transcriptional regulator with XRE-family HTH domain